jgi:hypothetical protein
MLIFLLQLQEPLRLCIHWCMATSADEQQDTESLIMYCVELDP